MEYAFALGNPLHRCSPSHTRIIMFCKKMQQKIYMLNRYLRSVNAGKKDRFSFLHRIIHRVLNERKKMPESHTQFTINFTD